MEKKQTNQKNKNNNNKKLPNQVPNKFQNKGLGLI